MSAPGTGRLDSLTILLLIPVRRAGPDSGAGCAGSWGSLRLLQPAPIPFDPNKDEEGRRDEDRGIGANEHAEQHRKVEIADHLAAERVEGNQHRNGRASGEDGARQRLVDRQVEQLV